MRFTRARYPGNFGNEMCSAEYGSLRGTGSFCRKKQSSPFLSKSRQCARRISGGSFGERGASLPKNPAAGGDKIGAVSGATHGVTRATSPFQRVRRRRGDGVFGAETWGAKWGSLRKTGSFCRKKQFPFFYQRTARAPEEFRAALRGKELGGKMDVEMFGKGISWDASGS